MDILFSGDWTVLLRTAVMAIIAYMSLVFLLRISGRRTLSKMNAFDLIVTIALGSTLATVLLNKDVSWAQGTLAFAMLIGMQYLVTWGSVRTRWVKQVVTGEPALLFFQGRYLSKALLKARVTEEEIRAAVRSEGLTDLNEVGAVVLETDGSFSILQRGEQAESSSLDGVTRPGTEGDA